MTSTLLTLSVTFLVWLCPSEQPLAWQRGESSLGPVSRRPLRRKVAESSSSRTLVPATKRLSVSGEYTNLARGFAEVDAGWT